MKLDKDLGQSATDHDGDGRQIPDPDVPHQPRLRFHRDHAVRSRLSTPVLILPDDAAHPYAVAMEAAMLAPKAEVSMYPWKEPKERVPLAVRRYVCLPPALIGLRLA